MSVYSHIKRIAPGFAAFALKAMCVAPAMPADEQETEPAVDFSFLYLEFPGAMKTRLQSAEFDLRAVLDAEGGAAARLEILLESAARAVLMNRDVNELDDIADFHGDEEISPLNEEILDYNFDSELGEKIWTMVLTVKTVQPADTASFESTVRLSNTISDGDGGTVRIQTNELPLGLFTGGAAKMFLRAGGSAGIINEEQLDRALYALHGNLPKDEYEELLARTREQIEKHLPDFIREKAIIAAETHNLTLPPAAESPLIIHEAVQKAAALPPVTVLNELDNYLEIALTVLGDRALCEVISERIDISDAESVRLYDILTAYLNPPEEEDDAKE